MVPVSPKDSGGSTEGPAYQQQGPFATSSAGGAYHTGQKERDPKKRRHKQRTHTGEQN